MRRKNRARGGNFDRWETYRAGIAAPARVATVANPNTRDLPGDWVQLQQFYTQEVLPAAIRANQQLMNAMQAVAEFAVPAHLTKALNAATCDNERRYVLDIIRETQYLALRDKLAQHSADMFQAAAKLQTRRFRSDPEQRNHSRAWKERHGRPPTPLGATSTSAWQTVQHFCAGEGQVGNCSTEH